VSRRYAGTDCPVGNAILDFYDVVPWSEMKLSEILLKMGRGEELNATELEQLRQKAETIDAVDSLVSGWIQPGTTIPFIRNLKAENINIPSGEITLGEGEPGHSFSGVRIAFPAMTYDGEQWNLVGVEADVLQVGIRASDGKLIAGGGAIELSSGGIAIIDDGTPGNGFLAFYDSDLSHNVNFKYSNLDLQMQNDFVGGAWVLSVKMTNAATPHAVYEEDSSQVNRTRFSVEDGIQGARLTLGTSSKIDLRTEGTSGGSTFVRMLETTATPPNPAAGDAMHVYMKADKFVIQYNDGGTVRYKFLDLTGVGVTWQHSTTAP
jgi:hypothetical protein